jgi:hypothetical protein
MSNLPIERAVSFLASRQHEDGFWRDYQLEPGRSEAWTTACVGFALQQVGGGSREVVSAAEALLRTVRPSGWGYNSLTASDADTTSWVIRFLAAMDALGDVDCRKLLGPYITSAGGVHTFSSIERFGTWGHEHDEVAPVVGMALLAAGDPVLAGCVRQALLTKNDWRPFWWRGCSYVCAQSLEFLAASGGIPDDIQHRELARLSSLPPASSSFDLAQRIRAATYLGGTSYWNEPLLELQEADGGWPASPELLVPSQVDGSPGIPKADDRRLMSTAMATIALRYEN